MLEDLKHKKVKITIENSDYCLGSGEKRVDLELSESSISKEDPHTSGAQTSEEGTLPRLSPPQELRGEACGIGSLFFLSNPFTFLSHPFSSFLSCHIHYIP